MATAWRSCRPGASSCACAPPAAPRAGPTSANCWPRRDMTSLRELAARAAKMPSQGVGHHVRAAQHPHAAGALLAQLFCSSKRTKTSTCCVRCAVSADRGAPRTPLIPPAPKKKGAARRRRRRRQPKVPPPPMPQAARRCPPTGWSFRKTDRGRGRRRRVEQPAAEARRRRSDGWSLVRTPRDRPGWVLTRLLSMAIPDEVAQYAEGKRIVSYFPLGEHRGWRPEEEDLALDHDHRQPGALGFRQLPRVHLEPAPPPLRDRATSNELRAIRRSCSRTWSSPPRRRAKYRASRSAWRRRTGSGCAANMRCIG